MYHIIFIHCSTDQSDFAKSEHATTTSNTTMSLVLLYEQSLIKFLVCKAVPALFVLVLMHNIIFLHRTGVGLLADAEQLALRLAAASPQSTIGPTILHPFECSFEEDFLIQLYNSSNNTGGGVNISIVSEYFQGNPESKIALRKNIDKNRHQARFIYVVGESRQQVAALWADIGPDPPPFLEVFYAPGGVTYRHLFGVATLYPDSPFLIHNTDIDVGDTSKLLNACSNLDEGVLVGSRTDILRPGANCREYSDQGSFDVYLTNAKGMDCDFLSNLRFPPFYWGAENVVASQIPKKYKANLCPYWQFDHYHKSEAVASSDSGVREHRVRINSPSNSWVGSSAATLGRICNISTMKLSQ